MRDAGTQAIVSSTAPVTISGTSESLAVRGLDQFGNVLTTQPTFTWSTGTLPAGASRPTITASGANATAAFSRGRQLRAERAGNRRRRYGDGRGSVVVTPVLSSVTLTAMASSVTVGAATTQLTVNQFLDQFHNRGT